MFRADVFYKGDKMPVTIKNVLTVEHFANDEEGSFVVFWHPDGDGERLPIDDGMTITLKP